MPKSTPTPVRFMDRLIPLDKKFDCAGGCGQKLAYLYLYDGRKGKMCSCCFRRVTLIDYF